MLNKSIRISRARIFAAGVVPHSRTPQIPALALIRAGVPASVRSLPPLR